MNNGINGLPSFKNNTRDFLGFPSSQAFSADFAMGFFLFPSYPVAPIILNGQSDRFPFGATGATTNRSLQLSFSDQSIETTVDFGDGNSWRFKGDFTVKNRNDFVAGIDYYVYPDGNANNSRQVTITVSDPKKVTSAILNNFMWNNTTLPIGFASLTSLQIFEISGGGQTLINLPDDLLLLESLTSISFTSAFSPSSRFFGSIPNFLFGKPLVTLAYNTASLGGKSFNESGIDKIVQLKNTLTTLELSQNALTDNNGGDGPLPANFNELSKLQSLTLNQNSYTQIPAPVNGITSLISLSMVQMSSFVSYGADMSGLVNLRNFYAFNSQNLTTSIPSWFSSWSAIRTLTFDSVFRTAVRLDAHITNLYNFVVATGAITGASTLPWRGIIASYTLRNGTQAAPTGTYQMPAGYSAGISNGTPASSKERIWVLVNQYLWTITTA